MLSNERAHKIDIENMLFNFGLYKPFISFLQKSAIFISNSRVAGGLSREYVLRIPSVS